MVKKLLCSLAYLVLTLLTGCGEEINYLSDPPVTPEKLYEFKGRVITTRRWLPDIKVNFDTLEARTDAMGYFKFDSIKSGQYRFQINDSTYKPVDTLLSITEDFTDWFQLVERPYPYFPLVKGNIWEYSTNEDTSFGDQLTIIVGDDTIKGGKQYSIVTWTYRSKSYMEVQRRYFRIEEDTLFEFCSNEERLLAPFKAIVSEKFRINSCVSFFDRGDLRARGDNWYIFYYDLVGALDYWQEYRYEFGIGLTRINMAFSSFVLRNYKVNF